MVVQKLTSIKTEFPRYFTMYKEHLYVVTKEFVIIKYAFELNKLHEKKRFKLRQFDIYNCFNEHKMKYSDDFKIEISDTCIYWLDKACVFHNEQEKMFDVEFFDEIQLFTQDGILMGATYLQNPSLNAYIMQNFQVSELSICSSAKSNSQILSDQKQQSAEQKQAEANSLPSNSPSIIKRPLQKNFNPSETGNKSELFIQPLFELQRDESVQDIESPKHSTRRDFKENDRLLSFDNQSTFKQYSELEIKDKQIKLKSSIAKKELQISKYTVFQQDDSLMKNMKLELILMVPIEQNYVEFVYQSKNKKYHEIQFATFLQDGNILLRIAERLFIYSQYGKFIQNVEVFKFQENQGIEYLQESFASHKQAELDSEEKIAIYDDFSAYNQPQLEERKDQSSNEKTIAHRKKVAERIVIAISNNTRFYLLKYKDETDLYELKKVSRNGKQKYIFEYLHSYNNQNYFSESTEFNSYLLTDQGIVYSIQVLESNSDTSAKEQTCFKILKDSEECFPEIKHKYKLIKCWRKLKSYNSDDQIRATFAGNYLLVVKDQTIEYLKVFENPNYASQQPQYVDLKLDSSKQIKKIMPTGREEFVMIIAIDQDDKLLIVLVWDLERNIEYSCSSIFDLTETYYMKMVRGLNPRMNYFCNSSNFYDFMYYFPLKFLNAKCTDDSIPRYQRNCNQKNVSSDSCHYLDYVLQNTIVNSYSLLNFIYFLKLRNIETALLTENRIQIDHFLVKVKDKTIFHLKQEVKVLELLLQHALYYSQNSDIFSKEGVVKKQDILLNILCRNENLVTAFDMGVSEKSPVKLEIYLKILILLQKSSKEYNFSNFIRKHFETIFSLDISCYYEYLDTCTYQHLDYQKAFQLQWPRDEPVCYIASNTSILTTDLISKIQSKEATTKWNKKEEQNKKDDISEREDTIQNSDVKQLITVIEKNLESKGKSETEVASKPEINFMTLYDVSEIQESEKKQDKVNVVISTLEFDWIFKGKSATKFIKDLAFTNKLKIFEKKSIQAVILFQWNSFFSRILLQIFVPFFLQFLLYIFYITYLFEHEKRDRTLDYIALLIALILGNCYQVRVEVYQFRKLGLMYFTKFWNLVSLLSILATYFYMLCDILRLDDEIVVPIASASILILWAKMFYFLKIFNQTSKFMLLIIQVFINLTHVGVVFGLAVFCFANVFYLLALNSEKSFDFNNGTYFTQDFQRQFPNHPIIAKALHALIYSFRTAVDGSGDNSFLHFDETFAGRFIWIVWLIEINFVTIILLSVVVNILNEQYEEIHQYGEQETLKELCFMMYNYEFVIDREKEFKNAKYIIIASLETGSDAAMENIFNSLETTTSNNFQALQKIDKESKKQLSKDFLSGLQEVQELIQKGMKESNQNMAQLKAKLPKTVDKIGSSLRVSKEWWT